MPSVTIRREDTGQLTFYINKKDLETNITHIEFEEPTRWGGSVDLADGSRFFIEPLAQAPTLPITLRAKRA